MFLADCEIDYKQCMFGNEKLFLVDLDDYVGEWLRYIDILPYMRRNVDCIKNGIFEQGGLHDRLVITKIDRFEHLDIKGVECYYKHDDVALFFSEDRYIRLTTDGWYYSLCGCSVDYGNSFGVPYIDGKNIWINIYFGADSVERVYYVRESDIKKQSNARRRFMLDAVIGR